MPLNRPVSLLTLVPLLLCHAPIAQADDKLAVAVTPFANRSNTTEFEALAVGLADMLMTDLSVSKELRLVERQRLDDVIAELKLNRTKLVDPKTAQKMGKIIGAELMVTGALSSLSPLLRMDARLVNVESGEVMATAKAEGPIAEFFKVEAELAGKLLTAFGSVLSPLQRMRIGKPPTRDLAALHAYSKGLDAATHGDGKAAAAAFRAALAADPTFAQAARRLAALEQRVAGLEKRTEAVERAGGLILKPRTAVDHFSNHKVHLSRGEDAAARDALVAALGRRPDAMDALWRYATVWQRLSGRVPDEAAWLKALGGRAELKRARAVGALVAGDPVDALAATDALLAVDAKRPERVEVARYLRLRALSPPVNGQPTAPEKAQAAALTRQLSAATARATLAEASIDAGERQAVAAFVADRQTWFGARAPGFGVPRFQIAAEPVAIAAIENSARNGRPFVLQVRIGEVGASEVVAILPGKVELPLKLIPVAGGEAEAGLWQAPYPAPRHFGWQKLSVRYVNRRGAVVQVTRRVLMPQVWNGIWRRRDEALGLVVASKWPTLGTRLAASEEANETGQLLVDPVANVWTRPVQGDYHEVPVLYASKPGAFATGGLASFLDKASGRQQLGLLRPIVYHSGDAKRPTWLFVGTGRYVRERERETSRYLSTVESIVGERGLKRRPLLSMPAEHALGLLVAGRWQAGVDLFLDALANHTPALQAAWLGEEMGAYGWVYTLAAAARSGHRRREVAALGRHMSVQGPIGDWLRAMAAAASDGAKGASLLRQGATLDAAPRPQRDADPWRFRTEAATLLALARADWAADAGLHTAVTRAQGHAQATTMEWPMLAALVRAHTLTLPAQVQVPARRGPLPTTPLPAALVERMGKRKPMPAGGASVPGFWVDRDEVSVDAYAACARAGACQELLGASCGHARGRRDPADMAGDQGTGCLPLVANPYPVTDVLQRQAAQYCAWRGGRLPTAAQWRVAALGPAGHAQPWGGGPVSGALVNLYDAVSCELRHSREVPAWCQPRAIRRELLWDGWMHVAPTGTHSAGASAAGALHMVGNVREWLAGRENQAAGCSHLDPPVDGAAWCTSLVGPVATPTALDVGFRCVYDQPPRLPPESQANAARAARRRRPDIDWRAVPAGELQVGELPDPPAIKLGEADSAARKALAGAIAGVPDRQLLQWLKSLETLDLKGEISARFVQELVSRAGGWGLDFKVAGALFIDTLNGADPKRFKEVFNEYINPESIARSWAYRARRKPEELSPQEQKQAVFDGMLRRFRGGAEAAQPPDGPTFRDTQGVTCTDQPLGRCADPMGLSGSRVRAEPLPARPVRVGAFELMKFEVTQAMFREAMGWVPSFAPCDDCPVERVTWHDAAAFCKWVGGRLPTEHEWAWAARGGVSGLRPGKVRQIAWTRVEGLQGARAVGGKAANKYGLHDMLGGVWEWVADLHAGASSTTSARRNLRIRPTKDKTSPERCVEASRYGRLAEGNLDRLKWQSDEQRGKYKVCFANEAAAKAAIELAFGVDPKGPIVARDKASKPQKRVVRGGSRASDERLVTVNSRVGYQEDQRSPFVGFRCAR